MIVIVESWSGRVMVGSGREGKVALQPFWVEMPPPHPPPPAGISLAGLIRACSCPKMYPVIVIVESWSGQVMSGSGWEGKLPGRATWESERESEWESEWGEQTGRMRDSHPLRGLLLRIGCRPIRR